MNTRPKQDQPKTVASAPALSGPPPGASQPRADRPPTSSVSGSADTTPTPPSGPAFGSGAERLSIDRERERIKRDFATYRGPQTWDQYQEQRWDTFWDREQTGQAAATLESAAAVADLRLLRERLNTSREAIDHALDSLPGPGRPLHTWERALLQVEAGWWSSLQEEDGWETFGATFGMSLVSRASMKFGRAEDGSLLVRQSALSSLMVLQWPVLPMAEAAWIRFPAAAGSPPEGDVAAATVASQAQQPTGEDLP
jgi:hypothetical protein